MLSGPRSTVQRARALRRTMSLPEMLLWRALRRRAAGFKVRRQHPAGPYVADFYCHEAKLIVAVDGAGHDCIKRQERDAARDAWFADRGGRVLRKPAATVRADPEAITDAISRAAAPAGPFPDATLPCAAHLPGAAA